MAPVCSRSVCCRGQAQIQPKSSHLWWLKPPGRRATLLGWVCSGGTQMAAMASSLLTAILHRVLWVWEAGPAPPWLLLPSFTLCFSQLGYQGRWLPAEPQANGQMGSPQLRTKSKTLLTLPVFLAGTSQKNFSAASIHLKQIGTSANLKFPHLPADATPGCVFALQDEPELFLNSMVLHLLLNSYCSSAAFVLDLMRQGNIQHIISTYSKQHITFVHIHDYMHLWYHKCLEEPSGSMLLGRREEEIVGNIKKKNYMGTCWPEN